MQTRFVRAIRGIGRFETVMDLKPWRCAAFLALGVSVGRPGAAQTADQISTAPPTTLQEVTVTATRRAEPLESVPISVAAFSQQQLVAQGVRSIDDLTNITPGVTFQRNGMSYSFNDEASDISIRGIDSDAGTSTTGVYIDDTPVQVRHLGFDDGIMPYPALFDVDRVEVLRGPQGTLFGAGSEGGTVRFISPEPGLSDYSGYALSEVGSTDHGAPSYEVGAAFGGPIIEDKLGIRVSASTETDGGYVDRAAYSYPNPSELVDPSYTHTVAPNANWETTNTFRLALKWSVNDNISVTPSFYYQHLHLADTGSYWTPLSNPGAEVFRNGNVLPDESVDPLWLAAIRLDWDLGFARLVSSTSYFSRDQHGVTDSTLYFRASYFGFYNLSDGFPGTSPWPRPGDASYSYFYDKQSNVYQEIRLVSADPSARITWTGGLFLSHLQQNDPAVVFDQTLDAEFDDQVCEGVGVPCPGGEILNSPYQQITDREEALFGEVNFSLTRALKLTGGIRVSDAHYTGNFYEAGALQGPEPVTGNASATEHPVTPRAVLSWQANPNNLLYVSAAKGYRVGGINPDVSAICQNDLTNLGLPLGTDGLRHAPTTYASDSLWSYELGAKNVLFDHRLEINSSVYVIDWKNIQQNVALPSCGYTYTANLGQVQSRGGDIEIRYRPVKSFVFGFTASYTDARFTRASCAGALTFNGAACVAGGTSAQPIVSKGDRLVGAPWRFVVTAEQTFPSWNGYAPYLDADFVYSTAQTALLPGEDPRDANNDPTIPGLPITRNLNLRAGARWDGLDLSLFAQNLTNDHPVLFESRSNMESSIYFAHTVRPREIGVTGTYRW